jgi:uncharacterized protein
MIAVTSNVKIFGRDVAAHLSFNRGVKPLKYSGGTMSDETSQPEKKKALRGFAAMSPEKRRAISSKGGKSAPDEKRTFSTNAAIAKLAGQKGGSAVPAEKRYFTLDRAFASRVGRIGGAAAAKKNSGEL